MSTEIHILEMFIQNVIAIRFFYNKDGLLGNAHFDTR